MMDHRANQTKNDVLDLAEQVKIKVVSEGTASFSFQGSESQLDLDTFSTLTQHFVHQFLPPIREAGTAALIDWADE